MHGLGVERSWSGKSEILHLANMARCSTSSVGWCTRLCLAASRLLLLFDYSCHADVVLRFYTARQFVAIDAFVIERKDKEPWPSVLLSMDQL